MIAISLPTAEVFARHAATGLTRYSMAEVEAALVECRAADAEWLAAQARAVDILDAHVDYYLLPGCPIYSERVQALHTAVEREAEPIFHTFGRSNDLFPVKAWLAMARAARASARRIDRATEKAMAALAA